METKKLRILITGGTGLIGQQLCKSLLTEGHELTVLSRTPHSVAVKCGSEVHAIASLDQWRPEQTFDAIINLAGEPIVDSYWTANRKQSLWDSRVTLTKQLVKRISEAKHKPSVLLSGSAIGYYGSRGDGELDESASAGGDFAGRLCQAWEQAALEAEIFGTRVCLLRTGLILTPHGGLLQRMIPAFKLGLGARLGNGKQWMSWVHIDDYLSMLLALLHDPQASGAYNMTSPQPVRNALFTAELATALNRPALLIVPAFFLRIVMGERAILLLEGQKVLPKRFQAAGFDFSFPTLQNALQDMFQN